MVENQVEIGFDVDEVLAEFLKGIIPWYNRKHKTNFKYEDFHTYDFWKVWNCSKEDAVKEALEFCRQDELSELEPVKGSVEGVKLLRQKYQLQPVTARPDVALPRTKGWLAEKYDNVFLRPKFSGGVYHGPGKSKAELCKELGINVLVEDNGDTAKECVKEGIRVILIDRAWNQPVMPKGVVRVYHWDQIPETIERIVSESREYTHEVQ